MRRRTSKYHCAVSKWCKEEVQKRLPLTQHVQASHFLGGLGGEVKDVNVMICTCGEKHPCLCQDLRCCFPGRFSYMLGSGWICKEIRICICGAVGGGTWEGE